LCGSSSSNPTQQDPRVHLHRCRCWCRVCRPSRKTSGVCLH
jgi:hypothetical protein